MLLCVPVIHALFTADKSKDTDESSEEGDFEGKKTPGRHSTHL